MKRFNPLRLERLEDRLTPSSVTGATQVTAVVVPADSNVLQVSYSVGQDGQNDAPTLDSGLPYPMPPAPGPGGNPSPTPYPTPPPPPPTPPS